jgi:hypothetical protein
MKKNYLLLIMALIIISCNDNDSEQDEYNYTFTENSDLKIFPYQADSYMKYGVIESGENLVFEYRFDAYDEELIADDEYSEFIRFEIDSELESFSYSNEELINIDLVFTKACFCYFPMEESKDVSPKGMISGEKISNEKWKIKIDLFFYGDDNRTIEGNFELK